MIIFSLYLYASIWLPCVHLVFSLNVCIPPGIFIICHLIEPDPEEERTEGVPKPKPKPFYKVAPGHDGGDGDASMVNNHWWWWWWQPGHEAIAPIGPIQAWVGQQFLEDCWIGYELIVMWFGRIFFQKKLFMTHLWLIWYLLIFLVWNVYDLSTSAETGRSKIA